MSRGLLRHGTPVAAAPSSGCDIGEPCGPPYVRLEASAFSNTDRLVDAGRHLIEAVRGRRPGPTLVVVGGLHGNEPAGVVAARRMSDELRQMRTHMRGEVVLLAGNTRALATGERYVDSDLNRHWTAADIASASGPPPAEAKSEDLELRELLAEFEAAFARARGEVYVLDLHTTSADGRPFATLGDTMRNRRFALHFPVTVVLGIEEQREGTMLEYLNNLGAVTLGFGAGQHAAEASVRCDEAVIRLALVAAGLLRREDVPLFAPSHALLARAGGGLRIVEVRHRHAVTPDDDFRMDPGFENFQPVRRGQALARDRRGSVAAREAGFILMPLYQKLGDDGFFLGREVKHFWLKLSAALRRLRLGDYVHLLPGVRTYAEDGSSFVVNTRIARILPLQVFHLLGFRKRRWSGDVLVVSRRRYDLAGPVIRRAEST